VHGGDRIARLPPPLEGEPTQRRSQPEAAELAADHPREATRQGAVCLLEAHRDVGHTEHVAEIDQDARHLLALRRRPQLLEQAGLPHPPGGVDGHRMSTRGAFEQQPDLVGALDRLLGSQRPGIDEGVGSDRVFTHHA